MRYVLASACTLLCLTGCTVIHQRPKPVKATYELEIDGRPVQKKTVMWEYPPDPMEEDDGN